MNIPEHELTPERCRELRQGGSLKMMINLLHAHTAEPHGQSEADFNPEQFLQNFNQHAEFRRRLADRIRKIILTTAENKSEKRILFSIELVRGGSVWFYDTFKTENQHKVIDNAPHELLTAVLYLGDFALDPTTRPFVEQFGGVFAILDLIRAQTRLFARNRGFVELQSHFRLLEKTLIALNNLMMTLPLPHEAIRRLLGNCRSFHEQLVTIIRRAHRDNELEIVQVCCNIISVMFVHLTQPLTFYPDGYMSVCGVVRCLVELLPQIDHPLTRRLMLDSLTKLMEQDDRNIMEFCSVDGSIGALADILAPNAANDADVENAQTYPKLLKQTEGAVKLFRQVTLHLVDQKRYHTDDRLMRILEERDIAVVLFPHIDEQFKMPETAPDSEQLNDPVFVQQFTIGTLFHTIIRLSDDQAQKIEQLRRRQG